MHASNSIITPPLIHVSILCTTNVLWASSKSRRFHQNPRKQYAKHEKKRKIECLDSSSSSSEQESEEVDLQLDECEDFIRSYPKVL